MPLASNNALLLPASLPMPTMADACSCGTEFLIGSGFCHHCGAPRLKALSAAAIADAAEIAGLWTNAVQHVHSFLRAFSLNEFEFPSWMRYLHFHEIKNWIGLPTASLVAFVIGIACVGGALLMGLFTAKTLLDWQAIQFYRVEWLLAATASFVAGILLKKPDSHDPPE